MPVLNQEILINPELSHACLCHLLITFVNSLDPDQARQNVGPDLDPNCLTLIISFFLRYWLLSIYDRYARVILKEFFEKVNFEKKIQK